MPVFVGLLATVAAFAAILIPLWFVGRRLRRSGGSVMNPFDEMFHPAAVHFRQEIQVQSERRVPIPSPGDPPEPEPVTGRPAPAPAESRPTAR